MNKAEASRLLQHVSGEGLSKNASVIEFLMYGLALLVFMLELFALYSLNKGERKLQKQLVFVGVGVGLILLFFSTSFSVYYSDIVVGGEMLE